MSLPGHLLGAGRQAWDGLRLWVCLFAHPSSLKKKQSFYKEKNSFFVLLSFCKDKTFFLCFCFFVKKNSFIVLLSFCKDKTFFLCFCFFVKKNSFIVLLSFCKEKTFGCVYVCIIKQLDCVWIRLFTSCARVSVCLYIYFRFMK